MRPEPRLLAHLDARIAAEHTPLAADCLRAERAVYLARQGRFGEVNDVLGSLHRRYDVRPNAQISSWLGLAEGLVTYFSDMAPSARDKIQRTHALSTAAGLKPLRALGAAWLAHMDYLRNDVNAMASHAGESLQFAEPEHHAARSRANLVVATALHESGRLDLALPWYGRARQHATSEGDEATLSALMYNMASLRAANVRQAAFWGDGKCDDDHLLMSADSSRAFDRLTRCTTLPDLSPLIRAQILSTQGHAASALALYEKHLVRGLAQGLGHLKACLLSDQAWARMALGQADAARADATAARACLDPQGQPGDRAPAHSRLAQVFTALGETGAAREQQQAAGRAWADHVEVQLRTVQALSRLTPTGPLPAGAPTPADVGHDEPGSQPFEGPRSPAG